jgi:predicted metal-dependent phosphoesterase TrpH
MVRVDLHTHSVDSPDGSLNLEQYRCMLNSGRLAAVAVTDHNTVRFAQAAQAELGPVIIVGEEVGALEGEIIGLFLKDAVPPGLPALETAHLIHSQGGLVYVPHPFERVRKGLAPAVLDLMADEVDIIETHNGRAVFQDRSQQAAAWARQHHKAQATASDAHGWHGWGRTCTVLAAVPTSDNLLELLAGASHALGKVGVLGVLYPKLNRLRPHRV